MCACLRVPGWQGKLMSGAGMQAATDEYIEQNEERFVEAAALLLQGRGDASADAASAPGILSLGRSSGQDRLCTRGQALHCPQLVLLRGA